MRQSKGTINQANFRTMFGYLFEEIEFFANAKSLSAKERGGGAENLLRKS